MLKDIFKSVQSTIFERIHSPFAGAYVVGWITCNWKLLYYFLVVDVSVPFKERIEFISNNFITKWNLLFGPIFAAVLILISYSILSSLSLWLWLFTKKIQRFIKHRIEKDALLTLEESEKMKVEIRSQEMKWIALLEIKDKEIKELKSTISLSKASESTDFEIEKTWQKEYEEFRDYTHASSFVLAIEYFAIGSELPNNLVSDGDLETFKEYDLIKRLNYSSPVYSLTNKGKYFVSLFHQDKEWQNRVFASANQIRIFNDKMAKVKLHI